VTAEGAADHPFRGPVRDLPLTALLLLAVLAVNTVIAKAMAARFAYPDAPMGWFAGLLFRVLPQDLLLLTLVCLLVLASRRLPGPRVGRPLVLLLLYLVFALAALAKFFHAGFFTYFGAPLNSDMVQLALPMSAYVTKVVGWDEPMLRLALVGLLVPPALVAASWRTARAGLVKDARSWRRSAWIAAGVVAALTVVSAALPVARYREISLRRVSLLSILLPSRAGVRVPPPELTAANEATLRRELGGPRGDAATVLSAVTPRRRNVVIWVWESVGERFVKGHHPFGEAEAPALARVAANGSLRFSKVHVECPLSAQSDWAINTGSSPPGNPSVYVRDTPMPEHPPLLAANFKAAGYRTIFLSSSYLKSWGETRFLTEGGFDSIEDANTLPNRDKYQYQAWSIEGRALVDRFADWQASLGKDEPFFAVVWNVESHFNYTWIGMPKEMEALDNYRRYMNAITYTDKLLGDFYDILQARGLDRDTLIVVVGDHGQGLGRGAHPYDRFHSMLTTEDVLHVPMVFAHPSLPRDRPVVDTQATLTDIYPTVLDLVGLKAPPGLHGASLARPYQPRPILSRTVSWWPIAVRAGRFKLTQDRRDEAPELYDLSVDPWETNDVSALHRDVTDALWRTALATTAQRQRDDPSFQLFSASDWFMPF
jgi:arylsulfatase A-like enzyme